MKYSAEQIRELFISEDLKMQRMRNKLIFSLIDPEKNANELARNKNLKTLWQIREIIKDEPLAQKYYEHCCNGIEMLSEGNKEEQAADIKNIYIKELINKTESSEGKVEKKEVIDSFSGDSKKEANVTKSKEMCEPVEEELGKETAKDPSSASVSGEFFERKEEKEVATVNEEKSHTKKTVKKKVCEGKFGKIYLIFKDNRQKVLTYNLIAQTIIIILVLIGFIFCFLESMLIWGLAFVLQLSVTILSFLMKEKNWISILRAAVTIFMAANFILLTRLFIIM